MSNRQIKLKGKEKTFDIMGVHYIPCLTKQSFTIQSPSSFITVLLCSNLPLCCIYVIALLCLLTLFGKRGHDGPQNVFDHCAQTLKRTKLKLGDLILIYLASKKVIFGSLCYPVLPWQPVVRGYTRFLKLSFHMFPYNEILKVFKSKI